MSLRKPFRAAPVKLGDRYRRLQRTEDRHASIRLLAIAAMAGAVIGTGSIVLTKDGRAGLMAALKPVAAHADTARLREPRTGDVWRGCNDARSAGTTPIYAGEPGYSETMDGDGDGTACEPVR